MVAILRSLHALCARAARRGLRLPLLAVVAVVAAQLVLLVATSCERRPLEVIVDERVRVRIIVEWKFNFVELYGQKPNGMTVLIWGSRSTAPMVRYTNEDNITVLLEPDTYRMVIFNERDDDYWPQMRFDDWNDYDRLTMRSNTFTVRSTRAWNDVIYNHAFTDQPEDALPRISVALDTFLITRDMVLQDTTMFMPYEEFRDNGFVNYRESERVYEIPDTVWPMTVDLSVRLRIKHRQSLAAVEGAHITGMADGFRVSHIIRTSETGIIRLSNPWDRQRLGDDADSLGLLSTTIGCFGLPYGKEQLSQRDSTDNVLSLCFRMANDSLVYREFNVGQLIRYVTPQGTEARIRYRQDLRNLELELALPDIIDLPPVSSAEGAGFDARVDEWEEGGVWDFGGF